MGRSKKSKKTRAGGDSDVESDTNEQETVVVEETPAVEDSAEVEEHTEETGKKEKKLSKKALQRMEQQKRAAEAPAGKKGKGKKKRDDSSDDESPEPEAKPEEKVESESESETDGEEDDMPVAYPIKVMYCPNCTFPIEMCEYSGMFEKCKPFLIELIGEEALAKITDKGRKRKILTEAEKLEAMLAREGKGKLQKQVTMDVKSRGNGRFTTYVRGLDLFGINMKDICKDFKKAFATGAGIASEPGKLDAVEVQGDFVSEIAEIIMKRFNVPKDSIFKTEGKNTFPLFGERPQQNEEADKKKKKANGKMAMEQQEPDFESGERISKAKIVVAEKREKVVKEEPERVRLFGPKVSAPKGPCFNCGQEGHMSKDCTAPRAPRSGGAGASRGAGGASRGAGDAGRGRGEGRGRGQ